MATTRLFAYNTGSTIPDTEEVGHLAISNSNERYDLDYGGVKWWMGPDESTGYVIAKSVPDNSTTTQVSGLTASVDFYRSKNFDESSFLYFANKAAGQIFTSGNDASTYLTNNGFWNNWSTIFLLNEDGSYLLQESNNKIKI
jgi:hypothetical protein